MTFTGTFQTTSKQDVMINLLISIATIALVDSINLNAMAVQIYLLGTPKPVARAITFIAGDFTASSISN
ncbi:hypothetical protein DSM106972_031410 [Dulcicalothrix desertica PCC 7102]|uniref:Uncharacterized protein n=1 Tax=Dulcicalothrix desertica PCC 7102 TaxID=232991 RepID=A0A3S1CES9_9CYAN|nr:hypothetical protein [Dulcicalothrix desertica]RUT05935.1 hypothetical protein DSM106972_031410 [Dulcicalothrix desertica PCC 7102]TWH54433.1 hypothetical protein CAL7102_02468 [Dulcicalothrix desertica PCC 7102]